MIRKGNRKRRSDCVMMMSMKKDREWTRESKHEVNGMSQLLLSLCLLLLHDSLPPPLTSGLAKRLTSLFFSQSMREVVKGNIMGNMSSV